MTDALGNIIPARWIPPDRPAKYDQEIVVHWLQMEAIADETLKGHPIIQSLSRWRNREVYEWVTSYDWTARMYQ